MNIELVFLAIEIVGLAILVACYVLGVVVGTICTITIQREDGRGWVRSIVVGLLIGVFWPVVFID